MSKVVIRRRGGNRPLECRGTPRIVASHLARFSTTQEVPEADDDAENLESHADAAEEIECLPSLTRVVAIDPARHAVQSREVHREEGEIHADEKEPEVPRAESFVEEPAGELRVVVIDSSEQSHHRARDEHGVEVRNDKLGVALLK